ncbi:uncharacterized protein LOC131225299 [Magnolia sinica]|uniref:uncharacterized protein LOC131225299 n=1 Tax=Magnolia sinica TaxID=86752 RepID=UPI00265837D0|nr:uncharacterized protein LOC131225299 [Magnolia sinica]
MNLGLSKGGGICKRAISNILFAFSHGCGVGSNNNSKICAVYDGLTLCFNHGLSKVGVESDSKIVVESLNHMVQLAWKWRYWAACIASLQKKGLFRFVHILREGNGPADGLVKEGNDIQGSRFYREVFELPIPI